MAVLSTGLSDYEKGSFAGNRVQKLTEFAKLAGISVATLRRLIKSGKGPVVTWMSARRCGIRVRHGLEWLDSRASRDAA